MARPRRGETSSANEPLRRLQTFVREDGRLLSGALLFALCSVVATLLVRLLHVTF